MLAFAVPYVIIDCMPMIPCESGLASPALAINEGMKSNGNIKPDMNKSGRPTTNDAKNAVASESEYAAMIKPSALKTIIISTPTITK